MTDISALHLLYFFFEPIVIVHWIPPCSEEFITRQNNMRFSDLTLGILERDLDQFCVALKYSSKTLDR